MVDNNEAQNQGMPTPDPALKRLNRLVDIWTMKGHSPWFVVCLAKSRAATKSLHTK
jgi:hypothetical protein